MGVMRARIPGPPMTSGRLLSVIRWVLPLVLAGLAIFFEWGEHIAGEDGPLASDAAQQDGGHLAHDVTSVMAQAGPAVLMAS